MNALLSFCGIYKSMLIGPLLSDAESNELSKVIFSHDKQN